MDCSRGISESIHLLRISRSLRALFLWKFSPLLFCYSRFPMICLAGYGDCSPLTRWFFYSERQALNEMCQDTPLTQLSATQGGGTGSEFSSSRALTYVLYFGEIGNHLRYNADIDRLELLLIGIVSSRFGRPIAGNQPLLKLVFRDRISISDHIAKSACGASAELIYLSRGDCKRCEGSIRNPELRP